ncbi:MAG: hypothetical protein F3743_05405 [Nitrospinae bacterium]|nr:hypothetical protein [Nitrospinota bacterium]MZH04822.1 hypothetical protein [Nitrospinota bacterium]MZH13234.1 hypothetical protein [Nitrospinota bacterium]
MNYRSYFRDHLRSRRHR